MATGRDKKGTQPHWALPWFPQTKLNENESTFSLPCYTRKCHPKRQQMQRRGILPAWLLPKSGIHSISTLRDDAFNTLRLLQSFQRLLISHFQLRPWKGEASSHFSCWFWVSSPSSSFTMLIICKSIPNIPAAPLCSYHPAHEEATDPWVSRAVTSGLQT